MASNARTVTEVDEVREERLRRRERDRLRRERETNEERCARFVSIMYSLCHVVTRNARARSRSVLIIEQLLPFLLRALLCWLTSTLIFRYGQGRSRVIIITTH